MPLEKLLGLPIESMTQEQRSEYVKVLRAARSNAPTLRKHVEASNAVDPVVQSVAKLPKKPAAKAGPNVANLLSDLGV